MADFLDASGSGRVAEAMQAISDRKIQRMTELGEDPLAISMLQAAYSDSAQLVKDYPTPDTGTESQSYE